MSRNYDIKNFENRLIFGEVIKHTNNGAIFGPPCTSKH